MTEARTLPTGIVTFVFTDMEGSTALVRRVGDAAFDTILGEHAQLVRGVIAANNGVEVNTEGDAFFVAFSDAHDAVNAAVELQRRLLDHRFTAGARIRLRIGMHTGEALLGGADYVGIVVHRAARISGVTHGGQIVVSDTTAEAVAGKLGEGITFTALGPHVLKDFPDPASLFEATHADLPSRFPPLRTRAAAPTNVPRARTSFVGRTTEVATVKKLLATNRMVTLSGVGGTGKTRLALTVAGDALDDYPDGVWVVELAPITDPALVDRTLASTLGVIPATAKSHVDAIVDVLARQRALVVLDNAEHLLDATAVLVDRLLDDCLYVSVLATSRERIGVSGEQEWRVPPLAVSVPDDQTGESDAVALFAARALLGDHEFDLAGCLEPVTAICDRLDGIPLAIELAAAHVGALSPVEILERLDDRLTLLTTGPRTASSRQRTLRGAIEWGYDLLDGAAQVAFARVGVFRGGFTPGAAAAVLAGAGVASAPADELIDRLVRTSVVEPVGDEGDPRFRMLETIREFAVEQLEADGQLAAARANHADWYLANATTGHPEHASDDAAWFAAVAAEHDNYLAAIDSLAATRPDDQLELVFRLSNFWYVRGHWATALDRLRAALDANPTANARRATALMAAARVTGALGDSAMAASLSEEARTVAVEIDDPRVLCRVELSLGSTTLATGDVAAARTHFEAGLALATELDDRSATGVAIAGLGYADYRTGDYAEGAAKLQQALPIAEEEGDLFDIAHRSTVLGLLVAAVGNDAEAIPHFQRALEIAHDLGHQSDIASQLANLAMSRSFLGDLAGARADYERAIAVATALGDVHNVGVWANNLGMVLQALGDHAGARDKFETALEHARRRDDKQNEARTTLNLGNVAYATGDYAAAKTRYAQCREVAEALGDAAVIVGAVGNLGNIAYQEGDYASALANYRAAVDRALQLGDQRQIGLHTGNLGLAHLVLGDTAAARECFAEALTIARALDHPRAIGLQLGNMAEVERIEGGAEAADLYEQARAIAIQLEIPLHEGRWILGLAKLDRVAGRVQAAAAKTAAALRLLSTSTDSEVLEGIEVAACIVVDAGKPEIGAELVGYVAATRLAAGAAPFPLDADERAASTNAAEAALGSVALAAAIERGGDLNLADALERALAALDAIAV